MIKNVEHLPYFTLHQFSLFYKDKKSASVVITRYIKQKKVYSIRKGVYITANKLLELSLSGKMSSFKEFIATNIIYPPSYLSSEYVLYENNIITENVYTFTLITTNKTANFHNTFGKFIFKSIKKNFFGDYETIKIDNFIVYKASPEKALFDYLYFKQGCVFHEDYIKELRLNLENIDFKKFENIVNTYNSKKVKKLFILLKKSQGL